MPTYEVTDLSLASALACKGHKVTELLSGKIVTFCFGDSDESIAEDEKSYWSDELMISALSFAKEYDSLKRRLVSSKKGSF